MVFKCVNNLFVLQCLILAHPCHNYRVRGCEYYWRYHYCVSVLIYEEKNVYVIVAVQITFKSKT